MIDLSLAGLIGAIVGTVVAAINYHVSIGFIERSLRAHEHSQTAEQRDTFEQKLSLLRRIVLAVDVFAFAAVGYWLGTLIGG